ncbi:MAG: methyltransferase domain-containing protein, partial [Myxococcales bacterium]|nr:methyltransferase domain-containing protein [Myxococcales bacterium]
MRRAHFAAFQPICLGCLAEGRGASLLEIGEVVRGDADEVIEGALVCPAVPCRREFPILDGIPFLVPDVREVVSKQIGEIRGREDLSPFAESLLGDCLGPGSDLDRARHYLSCYASGHWSDLDPEAPAPAALTPVLDAAFGLVGTPRGRWLDVGCSVGRGTFELAARTGALTLGVDLSFSMLRLARRIAREGRLRYPRRKLGLVYERREHAVTAPGAADVDFWMVDATALPFADAAVDGALSLNLLDCVSWPLSHLLELGRVLRDDGQAVIATPYDWSAGATAVEGWLG